MINLTILSLSVSSLYSMSPLFTNVQMNIHKSNFQNFFSTIFYNNHQLLLEMTKFSNGVGSILDTVPKMEFVYEFTISNENYPLQNGTKKIDFSTGGLIVIHDCHFNSIKVSSNEPMISIQSNPTFYMTNCVFSSCYSFNKILDLNTRATTISHICCSDLDKTGDVNNKVLFMRTNSPTNSFFQFIYSTISGKYEDSSSDFIYQFQESSTRIQCVNKSHFKTNRYIMHFTSPRCLNMIMNTFFTLYSGDFIFHMNPQDGDEKERYGHYMAFSNFESNIFCNQFLELDMQQNTKFSIEECYFLNTRKNNCDNQESYDFFNIDDNSQKTAQLINCYFDITFKIGDKIKVENTHIDAGLKLQKLAHFVTENVCRGDEDVDAFGCKNFSCPDLKGCKEGAFDFNESNGDIIYSEKYHEGYDTPPPTPTQYFTFSIQFSYSNQFSESTYFSESNKFSSSFYFSNTKGFTQTDKFSKTDYFSGTNDFSKSSSFSNSNQFSSSFFFSNSKQFSSSFYFSSTKGFTETDEFSKSTLFTQSNDFSTSFYFSNSKQFTSSFYFTKTGQFSSSFYFSSTKGFTETDEFSKSSLFTQSNGFDKTPVFSNSKQFTLSFYFTKTGQFSSSFYFSNTKGFTETDEFSKSTLFTQSNDFSTSFYFSNSKQFTSSFYFTKTGQFSSSFYFSNTKGFTETDDFSKSSLFTQSNDFTASFNLNRSSPFTKSNTFSESYYFTVSSFFSNSNKFSSSFYFSKSDLFTKTGVFTLSTIFTPSYKFTCSNIFTDSLDLIKSSVFTKSNTFVQKSVIIDIKIDESRSISTGVKAGIGVAAGAVIVAVAIAIGLFLLRRRKLAGVEDIEEETINIADMKTDSVYIQNPLNNLMSDDDPFDDEFI